MSLLPSIDQRSSATLAWNITASVIIHCALLWALTSLWSIGQLEDEPPSHNAGQNQMRVRVLDDSQLPMALRERTKLQERSKAPTPEQEKPKPKPEDPKNLLTYSPSTQIEREQEPEKASFSGRQANSVERETIKKGIEGVPNPSPMQPKEQGEPQPESLVARATTPSPSPNPTQRKNQPEPSPEEPNELENKNATPELEPQGPREPDIVLPSARRSSAQAPAHQGAQAKQGSLNGSSDPSANALFPNMANTTQLSTERGDGGTFNALRDIDEGDRTLLNRKHTRYWTFFDRMKRQLQREWNPGREYNKRDPYRNVYGVKDRYTVVNLTLKSDGSVQKLHLSQSSGLDFYDDEAIRALLAAAPFPNPPEGLKDEDGLIHIRYGFYLQISTGSSRFFRVQD